MESLFVRHLLETAVRYADKTAIVDMDGRRSTTYGQLLTLAKKVASYLRQEGVAPHSNVCIRMPDSMEFMAAELGAWITRCAAVPVGMNSPEERTGTIARNCGSVLIIDEQMMLRVKETSISDTEEITLPESTDDALIIYTSGSTGNPKGVLHEYGKIEQVVMSTGGNFSKFEKGSIVSLPAPLNFVTSIIYLIASTYYVQCLYILPYEITKDIDKLTKFLQDNKVTCTFMSPSLLRLYKNISPYLQVIRVGSEPCNGIFIDYPRIFNEYCSSETVFSIASFEIDKTYDITPAGKIGWETHLIHQGCPNNPRTSGY